MSLLREAVERALDPGYAAAAAAREQLRASGAVEPPGVRRRRAAVSGVLALLLGLAVAGAVTQLREPAPPEDREGLLRQIEQRTAEAEAAQAQLDALRAEVDQRQRDALTGERDDLVARTELLGVLAGTTAVTGPGLRVTLDDAPGAREPAPGADPRDAVESSEGLVLDRDLQVVANGLFAAGAEAVAINGQRLTSLASIRVAGQAILVDFQPLSPPYVIEALGDSAAMAADFSASPAGRYLGALGREYGITIASTAHDDLELPAGSSQVLRHARATGGGAEGAG
jgi:uncharacterized protein YlxW (UPF0749 family)